MLCVPFQYDTRAARRQLRWNRKLLSAVIFIFLHLKLERFIHIPVRADRHFVHVCRQFDRERSVFSRRNMSRIFSVFFRFKFKLRRRNAFSCHSIDHNAVQRSVFRAVFVCLFQNNFIPRFIGNNVSRRIRLNTDQEASCREFHINSFLVCDRRYFGTGDCVQFCKACLSREISEQLRNRI